MSYVEAIIALFAIVDPIGNIPILLHVAEHTPNGQSRKAFNTAVVVGVIILLTFSFAGKTILTYVFHIHLADLQLAGGVLLLSIARTNLDWKTHLAESLDPKTAERMHREACEEIASEDLPSADYCSMCGKQWCSVRINKQIRDAIKTRIPTSDRT